MFIIPSLVVSLRQVGAVRVVRVRRSTGYLAAAEAALRAAGEHRADDVEEERRRLRVVGCATIEARRRVEDALWHGFVLLGGSDVAGLNGSPDQSSPVRTAHLQEVAAVLAGIAAHLRGERCNACGAALDRHVGPHLAPLGAVLSHPDPCGGRICEGHLQLGHLHRLGYAPRGDLDARKAAADAAEVARALNRVRGAEAQLAKLRRARAHVRLRLKRALLRDAVRVASGAS